MKERILVIDDDRDIIDGLKFLLETEGYRVTPMLDGKEIGKFQTQEGNLPNLVLLDLMLPGVSGDIIAKKLKSYKTTKHIPIIMFSAQPSGEKRSKEAGADCFLAKPFDIEILLTMIKKQLN